VIFCGYLHVLLFLNNKTKINYRSEKIKRRYFVATLDHHKDH